MISKKVGVLAGLLVLIIFFLGFVNAEICIIKLKTTCDSESGYAVMGLSDSTNAHGQVWNISDYGYNEYTHVLCCDFERTHTCNGTNKIIGLSDVTNAHAEIPSLDDYGTDVCYGDLECRSTTGNCESYEMGILSLTDNTNAHIGGFSDYDTKICCVGICGVGEAYIDGQCKKVLEIYWANMNWVKIEMINVIPGTTTVRMIVKNSELPPGPVNFEIYENDILFDDKIRTENKGNAIPGTVDANGNANASWTITQDDLDKTPDDYDEFYFKVGGIKNPEYLNITIIECDLISRCSDYSEEECGYDNCEVADYSVQQNYNITCGGNIICGCSWDSSLEECVPVWEAITGIECGYCGDGYVRLNWEECEDGNHGNNDNCSAGCLNNTPDGSGGWYYCGDGDKNQLWEECDDGGNIDGDECSAQCQLEDAGEWCGDNITNQAWEECDDGNSGWDPDGCSPTCKNNSEVLCDEIPSGIGTCAYIENTTDCEEGSLTYSWIGVWTWDPENNFTSQISDDYIEDPVGSGNWHYDPQGISEDCVGGKRIMPCPAQIQLPFSSIYSVIAVLILIALIYGFLIFKKKKGKRKRSKEKD